MILSDGTLYQLLLNGDLTVSPIEEEQIQPSSIDLRLGNELMNLDGERIKITDEYCLKPNEFILGSTYEYVEIPNNLVARVEGRSSVGRLGLMVHITAGYIDPGFCGNITLELYNVSNKEFPLKFGDSICQLVVELLDRPCLQPYGTDSLNSKYQCSDGVVGSKYEV